MHACIVMVNPEMAYHGRVDADHLDVVLAQGLHDTKQGAQCNAGLVTACRLPQQPVAQVQSQCMYHDPRWQRLSLIGECGTFCRSCCSAARSIDQTHACG